MRALHVYDAVVWLASPVVVNPLVVVSKYPVLLYPFVQLTLHTGLLLLLVATVPVPFAISHVGVPHTA